MQIALLLPSTPKYYWVSTLTTGRPKCFYTFSRCLQKSLSADLRTTVMKLNFLYQCLFGAFVSIYLFWERYSFRAFFFFFPNPHLGMTCCNEYIFKWQIIKWKYEFPYIVSLPCCHHVFRWHWQKPSLESLIVFCKNS